MIYQIAIVFLVFYLFFVRLKKHLKNAYVPVLAGGRLEGGGLEEVDRTYVADRSAKSS